MTQGISHLSDAPATDAPTPAAASTDLGQRMLSAALRQYEANVADSFTRIAYDAVESGLIRLDERRRLARVAGDMGIREFDAQLLIACAVRQWILDHRYEIRPSPRAPKLSYEYAAWRTGWIKFAIFTGTALAFDAVLLYHWLH